MFRNAIINGRMSTLLVVTQYVRAMNRLTITHKSINEEKAAILLVQLSIINGSMV